MPFLRAHALSYAFHDAHPLFQNASFHLSKGFTGLVGENGSGKSTLLRLLSGEVAPKTGHVQFEPASLRCVTCVQSDAPRAPDVESLASTPTFFKFLGQLGLDSDDVARWTTLSCGERKRWQVAMALASEPDILLLDEPTNHLDAAGLQWLVAALKRFVGVGVLVSHDRTLLDALTTRTLRLTRGDLRLWEGSYSQAQRDWELEDAQRRERKVQAKVMRDKLKQQLVRTKAAHEAATRARSAGSRMRNKYDADARSVGRQTVVDWAASRLGRSVEVAHRAYRKAAEHEASLQVKKPLRQGDIGLVHTPCPRSTLVSLVAPRGLVVGTRCLASGFSLTLGRADRIHLAGKNGSGKSTFLRALRAATTLPDERILYLRQDLSPDVEGAAALARLRALTPKERGLAWSHVAALGLDPDRVAHTANPSPGETRKLLLGLALAQAPWLLLLDEPTNHLDLPAIEQLEHCLGAWPGALVLITHDERLARTVTHTTWNLET